MYWYHYMRLHRPSGNLTTGKQGFMSDTEFLQALAKWNQQPASGWCYYINQWPQKRVFTP